MLSILIFFKSIKLFKSSFIFVFIQSNKNFEKFTRIDYLNCIKNKDNNKLSEPYNSASAEHMTKEEIEKLVWG